MGPIPLSHAVFIRRARGNVDSRATSPVRSAPACAAVDVWERDFGLDSPPSGLAAEEIGFRSQGVPHLPAWRAETQDLIEAPERVCSTSLSAPARRGLPAEPAAPVLGRPAFHRVAGEGPAWRRGFGSGPRGDVRLYGWGGGIRVRGVSIVCVMSSRPIFSVARTACPSAAPGSLTRWSLDRAGSHVEQHLGDRGSPCR